MGIEAAAGGRAEGKVTPWWETRVCLALVVLATMVPLIYPPFRPWSIC